MFDKQEDEINYQSKFSLSFIVDTKNFIYFSLQILDQSWHFR